MAALVALPSISFAQNDEVGETRMVTLSAYYSPIEGQSAYFKGSLEDDRVLNGNGTNAADGTPVYPGMLAAPKSYAFNTAIDIPGFGMGIVHDRGGAIVEAGEKGEAYDRIDVWMGEGDDGLARAVAFGKQTFEVTVYPPESKKESTFVLPEPATLPPFIGTLSEGDDSPEVARLQAELKTLGYFLEPTFGVYDEPTVVAVMKYQLARQIITSLADTGAGVFGPATRSYMNAEITARGGTVEDLDVLVSLEEVSVDAAQTEETDAKAEDESETEELETTLFFAIPEVGAESASVLEAQKLLASYGVWHCEINGATTEVEMNCFDEAITLLAENEQTASSVLEKSEIEKQSIAASSANKFTPTETINPTSADSEAIAAMQQGLLLLGYELEISGSFDKNTFDAVADFQVSEGLIDSSTSYGAGWLGPKTRDAFENAIFEASLPVTQLPLTNPLLDRKIATEYIPSFNTTLNPESSGGKVKELESTLSELGYFTAVADSTWTEETTDAVAAMQVDLGVLESETDYGAGWLGPNTREALADAISKNEVSLLVLEDAPQLLQVAQQ